MAHTHLTKEDRFKIQAWLEADMNQAEIAEKLGKDFGTISRELIRNGNPDRTYTAGWAERRARERRRICRRKSKKLLNNPKLRQVIERQLKEKKSPEQIAGRRKRDDREYVCHETLYQFIYTEQPEWRKYLRQKKGKYRRRHGTKDREKQREIEKKRWITERPEHINSRAEIGHWEGDTVHGKQESGYISSYMERLSGYGLGIKLDTLLAEQMQRATVRRFRVIPKHKRKSVTDDNGSEFRSMNALNGSSA